MGLGLLDVGVFCGDVCTGVEGALTDEEWADRLREKMHAGVDAEEALIELTKEAHGEGDHYTARETTRLLRSLTDPGPFVKVRFDGKA